MRRTTLSRMGKTDPEEATPSGLISNRPIMRAVKRFFQQISQES